MVNVVHEEKNSGFWIVGILVILVVAVLIFWMLSSVPDKGVQPPLDIEIQEHVGDNPNEDVQPTVEPTSTPSPTSSPTTSPKTSPKVSPAVR